MYNLWGLLQNIFSYLVPFWSKKSSKLLFLGLENAGKTTLMYKLKTGMMHQAEPTHLPYSESLTFGGTTFTTYDLGGHDQARRVWKDYFPSADGIVFMVDLADIDQFNVSKKELYSLLEDEQISECPVAILANKIDDSHAVGEGDFMCHFGLYGLTTGKNVSKNQLKGKRPLEVFPCSILRDQGYGEAFRWLLKYMD